MVANKRGLRLERVVGVSARHNSGMVISPLTGEVVFPAGCIVVVYSPSRNKQRAYMRSSRPVASLAFSRDGRYLAVGECQAENQVQDAETKTRDGESIAAADDDDEVSVSVWDMRTYQRVAELRGHRFGISALCFSPDNRLLVSAGYVRDASLRTWDWQPPSAPKLPSAPNAPPATTTSSAPVASVSLITDFAVLLSFLVYWSIVRVVVTRM
jgi:hypothetical protein